MATPLTFRSCCFQMHFPPASCLWVLPAPFWPEEIEPIQRNELKRRIWLAQADFTLPLQQWRKAAKAAKETGVARESRAQPRNSLNRLTLTNGSDMTRDHIGQGLGGKDANGVGILSKAIGATVHQGCAPVLGIQLEKQRMGD